MSYSVRSAIVGGPEILVIYLSTHERPVPHHPSHWQTADFCEAGSALDNLNHGSVVDESVTVDTHEAEFPRELHTHVHTERSKFGPSHVLFHHDKRVSDLAASGVLADGQDEGSHHLAGVFVHHRELEAVADVFEELLLVGVLVSAEALALHGGVLNQ